jgi:hypothetical protein
MIDRVSGYELLDDELFGQLEGRQFPKKEVTAHNRFDDSYGNVNNDGYGDLPELVSDSRAEYLMG